MSKIGGTGAPISPGRLTHGLAAMRAGHFAASRLRASGDFLLLPIGGQRALAMPPERMPTPAPRRGAVGER